MDGLEVGNLAVTFVAGEAGCSRFNNLRRALGLEATELVADERRVWIVSEKSTATDLGYINVVMIPSGESELGFVLLPQARGRAVMSVVLPELVKQLNERLYTETGDDNIAAIRVIEKAGFVACEAEHPVHVTPYGQTVRTRAFRYVPAADLTVH